VGEELVGRDVVGAFDDGSDDLAEPRIGRTQHHDVRDGGVGQQRLLHLEGVHLLAAGVDHAAAATEELDVQVVLDADPVPRHDVADAVDHGEGLGRLLGIAVVAQRQRATLREHPE
jgi:hypothetical protein